MFLITALDLTFPSIILLPFLAIPVVASALVGGPALTGWLTALALALTLVAGVDHHDFSSVDGWLRLLTLAVAGLTSIVLARLLAGWRDRVQQREEEFRLLAENASDIVARVSADGTVEWISPSITTVLGWESAPLIGTRPWDLLHPDDRDAALASLADAASTGEDPPRMSVRFRRADGTFTWLSAAARLAGDGLFVVSFRHVDDEVRAQQALADSETRYRLLAENTMDMVFSLDMEARVQWVSPSATAMLGYEPQELIGQSAGMLVDPADLPALLGAADEARDGFAAVSRIRMITRDGRRIWVEATPRGLHDDDGVLVGGVIGVRDIQGEVHAQSALQREVEFDALTGLAKRSVALARIAEILQNRGGRGWALLCVGVRGMTAVNHAYTHAAGDIVLRAVADRLVLASGATDRVARIAGDEFVVLLRDIATPTDAASAAERLLTAVRGPVTIGDAEIDITSSVGIALAGDSGGGTSDAEELLRDATAAMRQAASKGPDRWEFLDGNVGADTRRALAVQTALREALASHQIVPWFMPVSSLDDGEVEGYEALVRWVREDGSVLSPGDFLDVAERTGLILAIDRTILSQTFDVMAGLPAGLQFGVNVSAATLASGTLEQWLPSELQRTGVDPHRINLEVTETALLHVTDSVQQTMSVLSDLGIAWWVDDFGTGFSSISHLRDLPLRGLKLDRSFTAGVSLHDSHATRLAQGLAGLAHGLGLSTIAEGVETPEQAKVLESQGWEMGQGWLFGQAVPLPTGRA